MNVNDYFEQVQEYIKKTVQNPEEIDGLIKELQKDNIQAVVNQDFNNGLSVEECGEKILKSSNIKGSDNPQEPNQINGDRALNKMERKIMKYSEFVNESKHYTTQENFMDSVKTKLLDINPFIMKVEDDIKIIFDDVSDLEKGRKRLEEDLGFKCYTPDSTTLIVSI